MKTSSVQVTERDTWFFTIRGIFAILFGLVAIFWPGLTILTLVYLFSAFIIISGIISLVSSLTNLYDTSHSAMSRILSGILGVVEIGVGVYLIRHTAVSLKTFIIIVGFALLARGVLDILGGLLDRGNSTSRLGTVLSGILAALAGIVIVLHPASSGVAFVWVLGLYALITGPLMIALGVSARNELDRAARIREV